MALKRVLGAARSILHYGNFWTSNTVRHGSQLPTATDPGGDVAAYQRTAVNIINSDESEAVIVDAYSQLGFLLNNGVRVVGPMALFPKSVLHWNVRGPEDVNEDSLSLFYLLEPKIDILVIGVGDRDNQIDPKIFQFLKSKGINLEVLPTDQACSTFNFLNSEKRYAAAALIPPHYVPVYEDEGVVIDGSKDPFLASDWSDNNEHGDRLLEFMEDQPGLAESASKLKKQIGGFGLGDGVDPYKESDVDTEKSETQSVPGTKVKPPVPGPVSKTE